MTTATETHAQLEQMGTKADALARIREAELAIAHAAASVFRAVATGEVEPCVCHYARLGCAQDDLEKLRKGMDGHEGKGKTAWYSMEALIQAATAAPTDLGSR